jgi:hypothetical protein
MKIFGDIIDDKIFPKAIKRFTQEEKNLLENLINSILREDKKSEILDSTVESFNDRKDRITETICKFIVFKDICFELSFNKFYTNEKKIIDWLPSDQYSLSDLLYNGYSSHSLGVKETLIKALENDKSITGIFVKLYSARRLNDSFYDRNIEYFTLDSSYENEKKNKVEILGIRTNYLDADRGGVNLTSKCKNHIKNIHFKIIKNTILERTKKNKL